MPRLAPLVTGFLVIVLASCTAGAPDQPTASASPPATAHPAPASDTNPRTSTPAPSIREEVARYLDDALDILEANSINRRKVDWPALRTRILAQATTARSPSDAHRLIKAALWMLEDHHSFLIDPEEAAAMEQGTGPAPDRPTVSLVDGSFGYVALPGYAGTNGELGEAYGTDVQRRIQAVDRQHPCGWIVDLRGNDGGNMWPMLIAVGPILGEGTAGSFVDADGNSTDWAYSDGAAMLGGQVVLRVDGTPYRLADPEAPAAVLFGRGTGSSGEVMAISFIGRPRTRSFGGDSAGLSTANTPFQLSDGAVMVVTTAIDVDRSGRTYGGALVPDVQVPGDQSRAGPVPDAVLAWLREQPACR